MLTKYVQKALERAHYRQIGRRTWCATVPGLTGVLGVGQRVESCRTNLASVVEEWVLVRLDRGLSIPKLGNVLVCVRHIR
jgi:predicted RNase H-like HicB family nuclease